MRRLHDSAAGTEEKGVRPGVRGAEEKGAGAGVRGPEKGAGAGVRAAEEKGARAGVRGHVEFTVSGTGFQVKFSLSLCGAGEPSMRLATCIS